MSADTTYYAIGDVHGMDAMLEALHAEILRDIRLNNARATIVHLGDYVDRGPDSRVVVERLMRLQGDERCPASVVCLSGNHEAMMLGAAAAGWRGEHCRWWLENGGAATLRSYSEGSIYGETGDAIPRRHLRWAEGLPHAYLDHDTKLCFVHAGIDPRVFDPALPIDKDVAHWTRTADFFEPERWRNPKLDGWMVVHGHTPTLRNPRFASVGYRRLNVDDGACFGGRLTCVRIEPNRDVTFCSVDAALKPTWFPWLPSLDVRNGRAPG